MDELVKSWGGELLLTRFDREAGSWIFIAIHSTRLGPATGGTRMRPYPDPRAAVGDALRLSEAMSYKYALAAFPRGGAKAVICVPPDLGPEARHGLLRRFGSLLQELRGLFSTGPDVGTSSDDMDVIAETGAPYVHSRTPAHGGAGDSGPSTALGVYAAMQAVCELLYGTNSLAGRRVLVQGAGGVGMPLIERLVAAGACVMAGDIDPAVVARLAGMPRVEAVSPEAVYDVPCDILSPCAMGGVLDAATIARLACRAVVGGANNQLATREDAARLAARGIVYAPDYAVNIGGAMAITGMEAMGWSRAEAEAAVMRVGATVTRILRDAAAAGITTEEAARRLAESRLRGDAPPSRATDPARGRN